MLELLELLDELVVVGDCRLTVGLQVPPWKGYSRPSWLNLSLLTCMTTTSTTTSDLALSRLLMSSSASAAWSECRA